MKVGVIGAGIMGSGIAQVFARNGGYEVVLNDLTPELTQNGVQRIQADLERLVKKGKLNSEEVQEILSRIRVGKRTDLKECDLILEAATENPDSKKKILLDMDELCKDSTIFATNTSSLSITGLGSGLRHPLVGMHFFNPAPVMKLVEIVSGIDPDPDVLQKIRQIAEDLGKTPVEVKDSAGFVVNRLLIPMINEAVGIYADGTASAEDIDTAMKLGANHPIGPLALADLIGLDVVLAIMEVLQSETGDSKYRAHPLLKKMMRAGWTGRKTGRGFYRYEEK